VRDIVLVLATLGFLPLCLRYPAAGAICWAWFSIMSPHRQVYGFAVGQQFNLVIAVATLLGWLFSAERKRWTPDLMPKLMLVFVLWMTFNSFFAPFPDSSWGYWEQTVRALALVFLVFFIANTKARIHGLIWILVISLGYYGVKGGIFTISSGGNYIVYGPEASIIRDNNQLALAVVMAVPLVNYLRMHTKIRLLQLGLAAAIFLEVVMVLGSHSRGGAIALGVMLFIFWLSTRNKVLYGLAGVALVAVALSLMPDSFWGRLDTISNPGSDSSFMGRVNAWNVATQVAIDRFPFGAGFAAPQLPSIFNRYLPGETARAAHSIYFQVLGEHGFIGLVLYLLIIVLALRNAGIIMRQTRGRPELLWAYDLANMIRVALIGFCTGGAALSMAYFDGFLLLVALLSTLRELTAPERLPGPAAMQVGAKAFAGAVPFEPARSAIPPAGQARMPPG
jgi:probable O-glycosylation ligase (exosortase A-associated)